MQPKTVELHKQSKQLELGYADGARYHLTAEYLRVLSPSAEVRGHSADEAVLQHGKKHVGINMIAAVGNYALQIFFDDQHDTGIYSWDYLYDLCINQDDYWQRYLRQLESNGKSRDPDEQVLQLFDPNK